MEQHNFSIPKGITQKVGWLVIVLIVLFAILSLKSLKELSLIGKGATETNQFTVTGHGESYATPDVARITFTVQKQAATVKEANAFVDEKTKTTVDFLKDQKIDEKDIKTVSNNFYPEYDYTVCYNYPCTPTQKLKGYTSSRTIEVKVRDLDNSALIVEGLAALEVMNLNGPQFTLDDEDKVQEDARNDAIEDARTKAESLAKALGVKLVRVVNFTESAGGNYPPQPILMNAKMMDSAVGMGGAEQNQVLPEGQNKYTSDVSIVYEIR